MLDMEGNMSCTVKLKERKVLPSDSLKSGAGCCGEVMVESIDSSRKTGLSDGCLADEGGLTVPITIKVECKNLNLLDPKTVLSSFDDQLPNSDCCESWRHADFMDASDESSSTPKQCVFDPFSPGPVDMLLAPISKKFGKEFRSDAARRLDFHDSCDRFSGGRGIDNEDNVEEMLLESVYTSILEATLLKQTDLFLHHSQSASPETPFLPSQLTGIAETCPRAPVKPGKRHSEAIDIGLCRKLEF